MTEEASSEFPRRPVPVVGESIYGFERRFACCTRYSTLSTFRHTLGLTAFGPRSVTAKWQKLASAAGQPLDRLAHMRWHEREGNSNKDVVSLMGVGVRATQVRSEDLRFCPHCLAEANGPERRLHLQVWQLHLVTACPVHGNLLIDACDECGETFWHYRKTKPWACACGREMTGMKTVRAPRGAVETASAIMSHPSLRGSAGYFETDRSRLLPAEFRELSLDDLLAVLAKIGLLAMTPEADDAPVGPRAKVHRGVMLDADLDIEYAARMMEAVHQVILDWPRSAAPLFMALADRNTDADFHHPVRSMFATEMGYRLLSRLKSLDGVVVSVLDDALEDWLLRERGIYIDGRRRAKSKISGELAIDVADAMRRLEGRIKNPAGIYSWVDAEAVSMIGKKVSLASVERTLAALAALPSHDLDDAIEVEEWSCSKPFNPYYRRADAIRDLLSGTIRATPSAEVERAGLAALRISTSDLHRNAQARLPRTIGGARRKKAVSKQSDASPLARRIDGLCERDTFFQPSRLSDLLSQLWPGLAVVDFVSMPTVRCNYVVRRYGGRRCPRRLYSVADSIAAMIEIHGVP